MTAPRIQAWLLNDGKAGHYNQTRAVVMALERFLPLETRVLRCKFRVAAWQHPVRLLLNATNGRLPLSLFPLFFAGDKLPGFRPDLVVSAGGNTCAANAWLGRRLGGRNLFCGGTRGVRTGLFSGVISAYPKDAHKPGFIIAPTPVPIASDGLASAGAGFRQRTGLADTRLWTMLIGGPGAGYHYTANDWRDLAAAMNRAALRHGIRWLVTTSRRSGPEAERILEAEVSPGNVAVFQPANATRDPGATYPELLGAGETIFCTEDSHMMISEAIATGKPVVTLQPGRFQTDPSNLHFLKWYETDGFIVRLPIATFDTAASHTAANAGTTPPPSLDALAAKLETWWKCETPTKGRSPSGQ